MDYHELADFIANQMQMQNVYQPVALTLMLESGDGGTTVDEMSRAFQAILDTDRDFRSNIRRYPGQVLIGRGLIEAVDDSTFRLTGFEDLTAGQRQELVGLCDSRLANFLATNAPTTETTQRAQGRVYVLTNPAMPSLIKVGFTARRANARAADLSSVGGTWLPAPFEVCYESALIPEAFQLEQSILTEFAEAREWPNREFLSVRVLPTVLDRIKTAESETRPAETEG